MAVKTVEKHAAFLGSMNLPGIMRIPDTPVGFVIFAHGAGSSRLSTRNNCVADQLAERGIGTLLFDLLSEEEALDRANVFAIPLLSGRMLEAIQWARNQPRLSGLRLGLFGSSTGAAAALVAAAWQPKEIAAVVSRGGRPDLAGVELSGVIAPTLLIVGGADHGVIELNEQAARVLTCEKRIEVVPGATHLFEEPGALDAVVTLAADWFETHLGKVGVDG